MPGTSVKWVYGAEGRGLWKPSLTFVESHGNENFVMMSRDSYGRFVISIYLSELQGQACVKKRKLGNLGLFHETRDVCANRLNEMSRDSYARFLMAMKARNNRNDNERALAVHFASISPLGAGTLTER